MVDKKIKLVSSQKDLDNFCILVENGSVIAIDIEFMRYDTFYPILCLIQVKFRNKIFIIDTLEKDLNLRQFAKLMASKKITKVMHSSFQDVSILFQEFGTIPKNVADTQIMANFLKFEFNTSYSKLVKELLNLEISKEQQRSNWKVRPLSKEQIIYAANDVEYLIQIYEKLKSKLAEEGKLEYFTEEMETILKGDKYDTNKQDLFKKFSLINKTKQYVTLLKNIVLWRDKKAKEKNIPRSFILKDNTVIDIAKENPVLMRTLKRFIKSRKEREYLEDLSKIITKSQCRFNSDKVKVINNRLTQKQKDIYEEVKNLLCKVSADEKICAQLIANKNSLKEILLNRVKLKKLLRGWRFKIFGKSLEKLLKA